jgi:hypothetical protein
MSTSTSNNVPVKFDCVRVLNQILSRGAQGWISTSASPAVETAGVPKCNVPGLTMRPAALRPSAVLFPDTNIFIEAKDLRGLPWEELASQEIRLLVCPAVLEEVDEHKTSPKSRVKNRALPPSTKARFPRVSVAIATANSAGPSHRSLDLRKADDRLVDWTLRHR